MFNKSNLNINLPNYQKVGEIRGVVIYFRERNLFIQNKLWGDKHLKEAYRLLYWGHPNPFPIQSNMVRFRNKSDDYLIPFKEIYKVVIKNMSCETG